MIWWDGTTCAREMAKSNQEVWTLIHNPDYAVSNLGKVVSRTQGDWRPMRGAVSSSGYLTFGISGSTHLGHRLVVLAFDGLPPTAGHTDVRHLDGNKVNNQLPNLRWGTRSENMSDVVHHRLEGKRKLNAEAIDLAKTEGSYLGGRTWDKELVEVCFRLEFENKLRLKDVAELLDVSVDVAHNIRSGRAISCPSPSLKAERYRRTPAQSERIKVLVAEGWDRARINSLPASEIGNGLSHQDFYYFKVAVDPTTKLERKQPPARKGELHNMAKVKEAVVRDVIRRLEVGEFRDVSEVQNLLGLSRSATYSILSGRTWSHIPRSASFKEAVHRIQRKQRSTNSAGVSAIKDECS